MIKGEKQEDESIMKIVHSCSHDRQAAENCSVALNLNEVYQNTKQSLSDFTVSIFPAQYWIHSR